VLPLLCLRLQRESRVRRWAVDGRGRGARGGGARVAGVDVAYPPEARLAVRVKAKDPRRMEVESEAQTSFDSNMENAREVTEQLATREPTKVGMFLGWIGSEA
jgi:hypothetical protein